MESMMDDPSIVKGKRTKRQRLQLPSTATVSSSSTSAEFSESTTEEEEDMANCLILLAQGGHKPEETANAASKFTSRRFAEAATTTSGKAGFYVYECKTCNKCFPSFQALGGHRASHKKPKLLIPRTDSPADETKAAAMGEDSIQLSMNSFGSQVAAGKARIHECSICGAEFSSGQALGGHMRRHRPLSVTEEGKKKEGNSTGGLALDLNLPAPSDDAAAAAAAADDDDDGDLTKPSSSSSSVLDAKTPPFSFASKTPILVLTSALVDCHY